jgi:hypothetical protein
MPATCPFCGHVGHVEDSTISDLGLCYGLVIGIAVGLYLAGILFPEWRRSS